MFSTETFLEMEYHIASRNSKALFTAKTDHLRHYSDEIVTIQNDVGLEQYKNENPVHLPAPIVIEKSFQDVLEGRKSNREFDSKYVLPIEYLSTILSFSSGYKLSDNVRKYAPSSGGFNEVEMFVIVLSVESVPNGIYYYGAREHSLYNVISGSFSKWVKNDLFFQEEWANASVIFILAADILRLRKKYIHRAYRLALLDVGHAAQNIYLSASALNLHACEVLGYIESEIEQSLGLDGQTVSTLSTVVVGNKL